MNDTPEANGQRTVLVVDDDDFSREVLQEMLGAAGIGQIHLAEGGRQALRLLDQLSQVPDLLICDVFMPDMDGIEFISELARRQYPGAVALVTGVDAETLMLAREIANAEGLRLLGSFTKPVRMEALTEMLALE